MKLTVIGSTGSMSGPEGAASCYLLQARGYDPQLKEERTWSIIMDLGPGAFGQLWRYIDPRDLDGVLITHGHADHIADIISLQVFLKWHPEGQIEGLSLFGPAEVKKRINQIEGYEKCTKSNLPFRFGIVEEGWKTRLGPFTISAHPGLHPVESYGYRVEGPSEEGPNNVTVAYTGDTDLCPGMLEMADSVDLLLSECGFTEQVEVRGVHLTGRRAGQLAKEAGAGRLVLTHIQPWTNPQTVVSEAGHTLGKDPEVAVAGATWLI